MQRGHTGERIMACRTTRQLIIIAVILSAGLYAGCYDMSGYYSHIAEKTQRRLYSNILVVSLLQDTVLQQAQERVAAECLEDYEVSATCGNHLFEYNRRYSDTEFDSVVNAADVEAVLVLRPGLNGTTWLPLPPRFDPNGTSVTRLPDSLGGDTTVIVPDSGFVYGGDVSRGIDAGTFANWFMSYCVDLFDVETNKCVWWSNTSIMTTGYETPTWFGYKETPSGIVTWAGCRTVMKLKEDSMLVGGPVNFRGKSRTGR